MGTIRHEEEMGNPVHPVSIPAGFEEDNIRFTVADVTPAAVSAQIADMLDARYYIVKEFGVYFTEAIGIDAYAVLNSAATDAAPSRILSRFYGEGSVRVLYGNRNGRIAGSLTAKPYYYLSSGTGGQTQDVECGLHYFYKS